MTQFNFFFQEELARSFGTLTRKNYHVQRTLQSLEGMCAIAKVRKYRH